MSVSKPSDLWQVGDIALYEPVPGQIRGAVVLSAPQQSGAMYTVRLGGLSAGYNRGAFKTYTGFIIALTLHLTPAPTVFARGKWTHGSAGSSSTCVWFARTVNPVTKLKGWHWRVAGEVKSAPSYEFAVQRVEAAHNKKKSVRARVQKEA